MFCSTIIPTVGRPSLYQAVASVLDQQSPNDADFEVIVVNDSGKTLPFAYWQSSERVTLVDTNRHERSVARNTGASIARGKYLHFLDDDDWMAPNALQSFWNLARNNDAGWLYGTSQLVDRQHTALIELHHKLDGNVFIQAMAGEWIPLQASLIQSQLFFAIGGFNPRLSGPEDNDLLRRAALVTDFAKTSDRVAFVVMGEAGSTTDYDSHPLASRWAREKILDSPHALSRLRQGATSSYWHGRLSRIYLTSAFWNLQNRRPSAAFSRALTSAGTLFEAGSSLLSGAYWNALTKPYQSETFARGIEAAQGQPASSVKQIL
jgi:hypothetical protein